MVLAPDRRHQPGRRVGVHGPGLPRVRGAPRGTAAQRPSSRRAVARRPGARGRDRGEHVAGVGRAQPSDDVADADARPPDAGAPGRLTWHQLPRRQPRRARGRRVVPREARPGVPAEGEHRPARHLPRAGTTPSSADPQAGSLGAGSSGRQRTRQGNQLRRRRRGRGGRARRAARCAAARSSGSRGRGGGRANGSSPHAWRPPSRPDPPA